MKPQKTESIPFGKGLEFQRWLTTDPVPPSSIPTWGSHGVKVGESRTELVAVSCPQFQRASERLPRMLLWVSWNAISQMAECGEQ